MGQHTTSNKDNSSLGIDGRGINLPANLMALWLASIAIVAAIIINQDISVLVCGAAALVCSLALFSMALADVIKKDAGGYIKIAQTIVSATMFALFASVAASLTSSLSVAMIAFSAMTLFEGVAVALLGFVAARNILGKQNGIEAAVAVNIQNKYAGMLGRIF